MIVHDQRARINTTSDTTLKKMLGTFEPVPGPSPPIFARAGARTAPIISSLGAGENLFQHLILILRFQLFYFFRANNCRLMCPTLP